MAWHLLRQSEIFSSKSMNPLLALTAARVGNNLLNNLSGNSQAAPAAPSAKDLQKVEFTKMMLAAANTPQARTARELGANGIGSPSDAENQLHNLAKKILQSSELGKELDGKSEAFELKFLPGGKVALKSADGSEKTFQLEGDLADSAQKAFDLIEQVKIAFPKASGISTEPGGSLRMIPGARSTLLA
jgi:hypothetical protein